MIFRLNDFNRSMFRNTDWSPINTFSLRISPLIKHDLGVDSESSARQDDQSNADIIMISGRRKKSIIYLFNQSESLLIRLLIRNWRCWTDQSYCDCNHPASNLTSVFYSAKQKFCRSFDTLWQILVVFVCSDESSDLKDEEMSAPPPPPPSNEESREPQTLSGIQTHNHRPSAGQRPAGEEEEEEGGGAEEEEEEDYGKWRQQIIFFSVTETLRMDGLLWFVNLLIKHG